MTAEPVCRLGSDVWFSAEWHVVFEELRRGSAGGTVENAGVTWERVDAEDGVFGPCPSVDRPSPPWLFLDRVASGRLTRSPNNPIAAWRQDRDV